MRKRARSIRKRDLPVLQTLQIVLVQDPKQDLVQRKDPIIKNISQREVVQEVQEEDPILDQESIVVVDQEAEVEARIVEIGIETETAEEEGILLKEKRKILLRKKRKRNQRLKIVEKDLSLTVLQRTCK